MALQIIPITYNIETGRQSSAGGTTKRNQDLPIISRRQKDIVLAIDLVRSDGSAVDDLIELTDTFTWAVDDDFDQTTVPKMKTTNSGFNIPGDRPDLDKVNGKLSLRMDADTAPLATDLGTGAGAKAKKTYDMELQIFAAAAPNAKAVFLFDTELGDGIIVKNILDDAGTGPDPTPVINFYNITQIDSFLIDKEALQSPPAATGIDAKIAATTNLYTLAAATEYIPQKLYALTREITGAAGFPTIQAKTSGGLILSPAIAMSASEAQVGHLMEIVLDNEIIIPAADIIQAEITLAGTSTSHSLDFKFNGQRF